MSEEEEIESDDDWSVESVEIEQVLEMRICDEDSRLCYLCRTTAGTQAVFDRSDLMDGAKQQLLVLGYERRHPPPWDEVCSYCGGEGCEECICDECDRPMRHLNGVNYGCVCHPVV